MKLNNIQTFKQSVENQGFKSFFNYPGFGSHTLFSLLGGNRTSVNERAAFDEAYGSSLSGKRSMLLIKNAGLNVAMDSLINSFVTGINSALVVVVTDDMDVKSSTFPQDSRHYINYLNTIWFEPITPSEVDFCIKQGTIISELLRLPVFIRLTNVFFDNDSTQKIGDVPKLDLSFYKNNFITEKYITSPIFWNEQSKRLNRKKELVEYIIEKIEEVFLPDKFIKELFLNFGGNTLDERFINIPLARVSDKLVKQLSELDKINICEYGDDVLYTKFLNTLDEKKVVQIRSVIKDRRSIYTNYSDLKFLFQELSEFKADHVVSDLTQFTVESTSTVTVCLSLGSSISISMGLIGSVQSNVWTVSGDSSFIHGSGLEILNDVKNRGIPLKLIIIHNGGTWCTGGQKLTFDLPVDVISSIINTKIIYYSTENLTLIKDELHRINNSSNPQCLILNTKMDNPRKS